MLKVLTSSCLQNRFPAVTQVRRGSESNTPLLQVLGSLRSSNRRGPYLYRRFFCSDSTDGSEPNSEAKQVEGEREGGDADSKASAAIVPTVFRPEDCLTVSLHFQRKKSNTYFALGLGSEPIRFTCVFTLLTSIYTWPPNMFGANTSVLSIFLVHHLQIHKRMNGGW